jgi:hypothetical protein
MPASNLTGANTQLGGHSHANSRTAIRQVAETRTQLADRDRQLADSTRSGRRSARDNWRTANSRLRH